MNLIFCFIIGFIGGFFFSTAISVSDKTQTVSPDEVRGVVRCKDCKWCHAGYCEKHDDLIPWGCANEPWEDWFCADGAKTEVSEDA